MNRLALSRYGDLLDRLEISVLCQPQDRDGVASGVADIGIDAGAGVQHGVEPVGILRSPRLSHGASASTHSAGLVRIGTPVRACKTGPRCARDACASTIASQSADRLRPASVTMRSCAA